MPAGALSPKEVFVILKKYLSFREVTVNLYLQVHTQMHLFLSI